MSRQTSKEVAAFAIVGAVLVVGGLIWQASYSWTQIPDSGLKAQDGSFVGILLMVGFGLFSIWLAFVQAGKTVLGNWVVIGAIVLAMIVTSTPSWS